MGKEYAKFKYEIGTVFTSHNRDLLIIDNEYRDRCRIVSGKERNTHEKWYKYHCNKCGNEDWIEESLLGDKRHVGCNVCCPTPRKIMTGINDITTTAPWMTKYFYDKSEAKYLFKNSRKKIKMVCPDCGKVCYRTPEEIYENHGLPCICKDTISYPNKFMYALLSQLNVDFQTEKRFSWSEHRFYDDYIEYNNLKIIVENHGEQHYGHSFKGAKRTFKEERENDNLKMQLAINNGIDKYFQIDCQKSEMNYIKNSIIKSGLLDILDAAESDINWYMCAEFATSNLIKDICIYKSLHSNKTLHDIAILYNLKYNTILEYIKIGNALGWCSYNMNDDKNISCLDKPIYCTTTKHYYRSAKKFMEEYYLEHNKKINSGSITAVCKGKRLTVYNLHFEYTTKEQFNEIKKKSPALAHGDYFIIKEKSA